MSIENFKIDYSSIEQSNVHAQVDGINPVHQEGASDNSARPDVFFLENPTQASLILFGAIALGAIGNYVKSRV